MLGMMIGEELHYSSWKFWEISKPVYKQDDKKFLRIITLSSTHTQISLPSYPLFWNLGSGYTLNATQMI